MMRKDLPRSKGDQMCQCFNVYNLLALAAKVTFVKIDAKAYFVSIDIFNIHITKAVSTNQI